MKREEHTSGKGGALHAVQRLPIGPIGFIPFPSDTFAAIRNLAVLSSWGGVHVDAMSVVRPLACASMCAMLSKYAGRERLGPYVPMVSGNRDGGTILL